MRSRSADLVVFKVKRGERAIDLQRIRQPLRSGSAELVVTKIKRGERAIDAIARFLLQQHELKRLTSNGIACQEMAAWHLPSLHIGLLK